MPESQKPMAESAASEFHRIEMDERRRNYFARALGIVSGFLGGAMTSLYALRLSLREYLRDKLHKPAFGIHFIDSIGIKDEAGKNITNYLRSDSQAKWLTERLHPGDHSIRDLYRGAHYPDKSVETAYQELYNATRDKGVAKEALDGFIKHCKGLFETYNPLITNAEMQYRNALASKHISGSTALLHLEEDLLKHRMNLTRLFYEGYRKYYENPIFDEMMKGGKAPGHMGLGIRHAHNKGQLILFSLVSTASLGLLGWSMADRLLPRGRGKKEPAPTFQQQIKDQREQSAATEPLGSVMH